MPDSVSFPIGVDRVQKETKGSETFPFPLSLTLGQFLELCSHDLPWIVRELLPGGGTSLLIAKPKVGKSTLVRHLIRCISRGESFLGREVSQGPVLYCCFEDNPLEVAKSFRKMGLSESDPVHIAVDRMKSEDAIPWLCQEIERLGPKLIVVDTLGKMLPIRDLNDYSDVNHGFMPLLDMMKKFPGTHLMFVHHASKAVRDAGDNALGSTAVFGNVDVLIHMNKHGQNRFLEAEPQRYGAHLPAMALSMCSETGGISGTVVVDGDDDGTVCDRIITALSEGEKTAAELRKAIRVKTNHMQAVIAQLVEEGTLARRGSGKRGSPHIISLA